MNTSKRLGFSLIVVLLVHTGYAQPQPIGIFDNHADIGAVSAPGEATYNPDQKEYEIKGSGSDIWGNSDEFHFVYKELSGNFRLRGTMLVYNEDGTSDWAKAVLMIRNTLDTNSSFFDVLVRSRDQKAMFQHRAFPSNEAIAGLFVPDTLHDAQFELIRIGNTVQGFYIDPTTGESVLYDTKKIELEELVYAGLGVTSHDDGAYATGVFTDVVLEAIPAAGVRELSHVLYTPLEPIQASIELSGESGEITVQENPPEDWQITDISDGGIFQNGTITWELPDFIGSQTLTYMATPPEGFSENAQFNGAVNGFDIIGDSTLSKQQALGIFTAHQDIGNVMAAGSAEYHPDDGTYILTGSGEGIWSQSDEFYFAYLEMNENFKLLANITPEYIDTQKAWSMAGLMVRNTLAPNDLYFGFGLRAKEFMAEAQYRATVNGTAGFSNLLQSHHHDHRLEVVRTGNYMSAYYYDAGTGERILFKQEKIECEDPVYTGFYVTSYDDGHYAKGTFQDVQLTPLPPSAERIVPQTSFSPNEPVEVSLNLFGTGDAIRIEEHLPEGWNTENISHEGSTTDGTITWSLPAVSGDEELTYTAIPPSTATEDAVFRGFVGELEINGVKSLPFLKQVGAFENYADVGKPSPPGTIEYDPETGEYVMFAGGKDLLATDYFFVYSEVAGDFRLRAKVVAENRNASAWGVAGIGVYDELVPAPIAYAAVVRSNAMNRNAGYAYRTTPGSIFGGSIDLLKSTVQDGQLELIRRGNEITMNYFNIQTNKWTQANKSVLNFTDPVYVGLVSGSGKPGAFYEVHYTNVEFEVETTEVSEWQLY